MENRTVFTVFLLHHHFVRKQSKNELQKCNREFCFNQWAFEKKKKKTAFERTQNILLETMKNEIREMADDT